MRGRAGLRSRDSRAARAADGRNIIHGSDAVESANREIALWVRGPQGESRRTHAGAPPALSVPAAAAARTAASSRSSRRASPTTRWPSSRGCTSKERQRRGVAREAGAAARAGSHTRSSQTTALYSPSFEPLQVRPERARARHEALLAPRAAPPLLFLLPHARRAAPTNARMLTRPEHVPRARSGSLERFEAQPARVRVAAHHLRSAWAAALFGRRRRCRCGRSCLQPEQLALVVARLAAASLHVPRSPCGPPSCRARDLRAFLSHVSAATQQLPVGVRRRVAPVRAPRRLGPRPPPLPPPPPRRSPLPSAPRAAPTPVLSPLPPLRAWGLEGALRTSGAAPPPAQRDGSVGSPSRGGGCSAPAAALCAGSSSSSKWRAMCGGASAMCSTRLHTGHVTSRDACASAVAAAAPRAAPPDPCAPPRRRRWGGGAAAAGALV